jgi:hypothetical protein
MLQEFYENGDAIARQLISSREIEMIKNEIQKYIYSEKNLWHETFTK